jgi:hypothetical protein
MVILPAVPCDAVLQGVCTAPIFWQHIFCRQDNNIIVNNTYFFIEKNYLWSTKYFLNRKAESTNMYPGVFCDYMGILLYVL